MNEDVPILPALLALWPLRTSGSRSIASEAGSARSSICSTRKRA